MEGLEEDKVQPAVVWGRCLEGLAGFGGFGAFGAFGEFWRVCGLANGSFESLRKPLLWPGPGVPVGEVALALGCILGKVFGILEVWILCRLANGSFESIKKVIAVDLRCLGLRAGKRQL